MGDEIINQSGEGIRFEIIDENNWRGLDQEKVKGLSSGTKW